ncbi:MAG: hypothetical protein Q9214_002476 [Letrouitia sp. 1 TL-2023]
MKSYVNHNPPSAKQHTNLFDSHIAHNSSASSQGSTKEASCSSSGPIPDSEDGNHTRFSIRRGSSASSISSFTGNAPDRRYGATENGTFSEFRRQKPDSINGLRDRPRSLSRSLSALTRNRSTATSPSPSTTPSRHGPASTWSGSSKISKTSPTLYSSARQKDDFSVLSIESEKARKNSRRPLSTLFDKNLSFRAPLVPAFSNSSSTDTLSYLERHGCPEKTFEFPSSSSLDKMYVVETGNPRKKDELWTSFCALEAEYQKFLSRPTISKTTVVRAGLLPFLKTYAEHSSNTRLRPEDLDWRITILNKWWTGLLEMLVGKNGESVAGSDRPVILDAITAIMIRPEWNLPYSSSFWHSERTQRPPLKSRSTTSLASFNSDSFLNSIFHKVRNTYGQNLLVQMSYVVEKMSSRNIPASVVSFCGKTTAYAFFFCDGVAEILVRLWATSSEAIKRVLAEYGLERGVDLKVAAHNVSASFPSCLQNLAFISLRSTVSALRREPRGSTGTAYIPWHGPWVGRWRGRDCDLLYVFTKCYYHLLCLFLPDQVTQQDRISAPGFVLVQAQLLTVLDSLMQRTTQQHSPDVPYVPPATFDDILGVEANTSASLLPVPPAPNIRSMAENRFIILVRDCLSQKSHYPTTIFRHVFAESIELLLRAVARRISIYDHSACFTLCDFMEEAIVLLMRYSQVSITNSPVIQWSFWFKVCKQMIESHNIMTEIRLFATLYSLWPTITADQERKEILCLGWLLDEELFEKQFNHWCPMVRAYYMRLLCWRVSRLDSSASDVDLKIVETLFLRLRGVWSHFTHIQEQTRINGTVPLSTAPCSPAPGRRLVILRNDSQPSFGGILPSFDKALPAMASSQPSAYLRHSSVDSHLNLAAPLTSPDPGSHVTKPGKKRWAMFKTLLPFLGSSRQRSLRADENHRKTQPTSPGTQTPPAKPGRGIAYQAQSFKFSLEWINGPRHPFGRELSLSPPKLPPLTEHVLQMPFEAEPQDNKTFCKPNGLAGNLEKYTGRALAEWAILVDEQRDFVRKRKLEGIPDVYLVETPTLRIDDYSIPKG